MEQTTPTLLSNLITVANLIQNDAVGMLTSIIPQLAPIVGAGIVARLGLRFIKRFSN